MGSELVRILCVCTGNICRSPTAQIVLQHLLREANLADRVVVDSAATHDYHVGEGADPRALIHAEQRGYILAGHRVRQIMTADFLHHDLIIAMDRGNLRSLERKKPALTSARLCLYLDFALDQRLREVPDPYYGSAEGFETVLDLLEIAGRGLMSYIKQYFAEENTKIDFQKMAQGRQLLSL
jgi:protein-tyrosine phosphatase